MTAHLSACDIIFFGALGDLTQRKLLPALYQLERAKLIHKDTRIICVARNTDQDKGIGQTRQSLTKYVSESLMNTDVLEAFIQRIRFLSVNFDEIESYRPLKDALDSSTNKERVFYYATSASLYGTISANLSEQGCLNEQSRVVLEKPIGFSLETSHQVNSEVGKFFDESQIYRIDHYLGKETVQNLIALRFANNLFGTQWNQNHISHVEITVAEKVGIEGRWGYFDKAGQLRDMVQNHLLQLLCLVAMDPPADLSADSIRDEKVKVLKSLRPIKSEEMGHHVVRGQYTSGYINDQRVPGYLDEEGANTSSQTETFVSIRVELGSWRWAGVPFYLRTGKRMAEKSSQIVVHFKQQPHYIFDPEQRQLANNKLIIKLQPDEGIALHILTKDQGLEKGMQLRKAPLQLSFSQAFGIDRVPDAYERLLLEVIKGQQYLFVRRDEIEHAWKWCDALLNQWQKQNSPPLPYPAGSWGPANSDLLLANDGRVWYENQ
ncbi:glucose-6-phosphate dehydrogenase [Nitrincola tibetensis]|uniref:Glucose-6-phosphate 1-dehydrogenase n=1 Tax=Nitrincola tibetensis TaxID=2219697 RepID=A0A364NJI3_9GAMM|nr:glucose-6-phosphate dehydrogenase [Nitrincola tibetensis]RAU17047.1 glucose-6-phosphate dehydrogenase [Nitrincola tibetensis]